MPSLSSCGRSRVTKRSIPGLARPIEFSIPTSVSTIRTGALPSRGRGVTVLVTNPSRLRAMAGAVSASRQPDALSSIEDRPFDAETFEDAVDLDRTAVAGAKATCHGRLPRELRLRRDLPDGREHRLRATREDVWAR